MNKKKVFVFSRKLQMTYTKDIQSNVFITDTKGTGISVLIREVSVVEKKALYGFQSLRD